MMRKIILFGTGKYGLEALDYFGSDNVAFFADNNVNIQGSFIRDIEVIAPSRLNGYADNAIIVLAAGYSICTQMEYQLKSMGIEKYVVYRYLREHLASEGNKTSKDFIDEFQTDAGIYRLMYLYADNLHKCSEERIEFFMRTADVRGVKPAHGILRNRQLQLLQATLKVRKLADYIGINMMLCGGNLVGAVRNGGFVPWDDDVDVMLIRKDYNKLIEYCRDNNMLYIADDKVNNQDGIYKKTINKMHSSNSELIFSLNGDFLAAYIKYEKSIYIVDIFPLDYYQNNCTYSDLKEYAEECRKFCQSENMSVESRLEYNKKINKNKKYVSDIPTEKIGYGIEVFFAVNACNGFCRSESVFPLSTISFEEYDFSAPGNPVDFLKMDYGNIYQWPSDAGQTAHGIGRHYIQYRHFDNPVYILDVFSAKQVSNNAGPVIIEKYKMQDVEEYFRVIEELEEKEITYYVYT